MRNVLLLFISITILLSCDNKKESQVIQRQKEVADSVKKAKEEAENNKPCNRLGKYLYIDALGVLHIRLHCHLINDGGSLSGTVLDENGEEVDVSHSVKCGSGVKRVLLKDFDKSLLNKSCRGCIDDDMYEFLLWHDKKKHLGVDWKSDSENDDKKKFTEDDIDQAIKSYATAKNLAKKYGF